MNFLKNRYIPTEIFIIVFYFVLWFFMYFSVRIPSDNLYIVLLFSLQLFFWISLYFIYNKSTNSDLEKFKFSIFIIMVFMFCFQNIGLGIISGTYLDRLSGQLLIVMKSIFVFSFIIYLLIVDNKVSLKIDIVDFVGLLFIFYCVLSFIFSEAPVLSRASNLRNFIMPIVLVFLGRKLLFTNYYLLKLIKYLYYLCLLFGIIGMIEYFLISDPLLFKLIGLKEVFFAKIGKSVVPGTLYSNEGGIYIRRMISVFYDPLTLGFFFSTVSVYAISIRKLTFLPFIFLCLFFTYHKAGILIVLISISYLIIQKFNLKIIRTLAIYIMIATMFGGMYYIIINYPTSAISHLKGLYGGLSSIIIKPFGYGIGTGGYFSWMYGIVEDSKAAYSLGADSGVGSIARQVGIPGLVFYFLWIILILKKLISFRKTLTNKHSLNLRIINSLIVMIGSYVLLVFLTENILSLYANYLIFIFSGIFLERYKNSNSQTILT